MNHIKINNKKTVETYIVECCAPTLASLKTGNLFTISLDYKTELKNFIKTYKEFFEQKGLGIKVLSEKQKILVYVYRYSKLKEDLSNIEVREFLKVKGYKLKELNGTIEGCVEENIEENIEDSIEETIENLSKNIKSQQGFPHEIGLFLGYPIDDVKSFIEENGQNFKACGYWKVYNNEEASLKTFERFNKCKNVYCKMYSQGQCIKKLTVSAW